MIPVSVTAQDIAAGVGGDCLLCPVAIALARDTGDAEAIVFEKDWTLRLQVWGRSIVAPSEVRQFVRAFDDQPRKDDGRLDDKDKDYDPPVPFAFELPDQGDPEWEESCYRCEELFDPAELDDEGVCESCLALTTSPERTGPDAPL
jgi:hypothetical protein